MKDNFDSKIQYNTILRVEDSLFKEVEDALVIEAPLEIRIQYFILNKWHKKKLAITMRTPGNDKELALGFLVAEGIIGQKGDVLQIEQVEKDIILLQLAKHIQIESEGLKRNFAATASCGLCGKSNLEQLEKITCYYPLANQPIVSANNLKKLPQILKEIQPVFEKTGGIHAAAIFSIEGVLLAVREDVGRHNALDKLMGACLSKQEFPLRQHILMLSGRVGFELVQKAMMAGIPIIAAVGAPSSLAIQLAENAGITIIGFLKANRFNIYCGRERIQEVMIG
jgi:FdhD protein